MALRYHALLRTLQQLNGEETKVLAEAFDPTDMLCGITPHAKAGVVN